MKRDKILRFIQCLLELSPKQKLFILRNITDIQLKDIVEIIYNVLHGVCPVQAKDKAKLKKYKSVLRKLTASDVSFLLRKKQLLKIESILPIFFNAYIRYVKGIDLDTED